MMDGELETILKEAIVAEPRYCSGICLEEKSKTTKNLNQDVWWPGQDSNRIPLEHKSRALLLRQSAR
jgi:hypothetical protein